MANLYNRKSIFFSALACVIFFLNSCEKKSGIPAYIHIDKINFNALPAEGSASQKITDVWVYINGQALGAYELPCTFPVLADGSTDVVISPGIMKNGIADDRTAYEFYSSNVTKESLSPLHTDTIVPSFGYIPSLHFWLQENFELGSNFINNNSDTGLVRSNYPAYVFEGTTSGLITLTTAKNNCEIINATPYVLPTDGHTVFAELNYKNDIPFSVGIQTLVSGVVEKYYQVTLLPKSSWNKVYVDLTPPVSGLRGSSYQLLIKADLPDSLTSANIILDNIKLISR